MFEAAYHAQYANSDMLRAILKGNLEETKRAVGNGANIDYSPMDASVLLVAGIEKKWDIVDYLLDEGANINARNSFNLGILHLLCKDGPLDLVEKLVSMGTLINTKDNDLETPFAVAVKNNRHDIVDYFLDITTIDFTSADKHGKTTLHYAAQLGLKDMFMKLWYHGVDLSLRDNKNNTAIDYIKDEEWKRELPEFEKQIIQELKKQEEKNEVISNSATVQEIKDTLKATGISSIKRRVAQKLN